MFAIIDVISWVTLKSNYMYNYPRVFTLIPCCFSHDFDYLELLFPPGAQGNWM